jgi:hypothetical protein
MIVEPKNVELLSITNAHKKPKAEGFIKPKAL